MDPKELAHQLERAKASHATTCAALERAEAAADGELRSAIQWARQDAEGGLGKALERLRTHARARERRAG
jgi:hypothetical protein